ncbi:MAG TPA: response regulator, partial [Desulfobulbaceae bacterium]|nr:response regulator [Desulfobulbaceae bacterium]
PLSEISNVARDIAHGNFGRQIHLETGDEIEMLADQFNLMSAALEKSYNALTSYNDDLAREVKKRTHAQQVVNRRLRSILQTTDQGFWLVDNTLITREINPRMAEILGRPSEEIVGRSILEFFSGKDREFFELSLRGETGEKTRRRQVILKRSGRSSLACLVGVTPLMLGEFGVRSGAFAMFTDVSVLKTVMRKLRFAKENAEKANRAKSYFLANMSHEIRTPLNGIVGMLHLLSGTQLEKEQKKMLRSAQYSSDFLLNLLNDLLDLSKIEAGQLELEKRPFSISGLLDQLESMFSVQAAERGLKFTTSLSQDVPAVLIGDHLRLRQILTNLLSNSFKFTRQGFIAVHIGLADRTEKRVVLHCRVEDTGIGVARDKQDEIFQSFTQADSSTTRNFGGTGLGLAICRELSALMNGSIRLESEEGHGSIFHCTVDLAIGTEEQLLGYEQPAETETTDIGPLSILVAEDNATNREVAQMTLEQDGHRITLARDGIEALEKMTVETFDLVLMDMQMPKMDGVTACRLIRDCERGEVAAVDDALQSLLERLVKKIQGGYTPIIALTANVMRTDRERCVQAGMDDYLSKPIQPQEITRVLSRFSPVKKRKSSPEDTPSIATSREESDPLTRARNHLRSMYNFTDEQFEKLLQTALATLRTDLADLERAFADGNMELVSAKAHKCKGSLVMLGLQDAADNTAKIETHVREKKIQSIGGLIDELQRKLAEVLV